VLGSTGKIGTYSAPVPKKECARACKKCGCSGVDRAATGAHDWTVNVSQDNPQVRFEQEGATLTAVEITREQRSPVIAVLQRTLFALGIVVSSYQARAGSARLIERIRIERSDGGSIDGALSAATKAAILPIALQQDSLT
jgi:hypothetical protein